MSATGYAVQLYFDDRLEAAVLEVRAHLTSVGVTPNLERLGDRPHVSLAVMNEVSIDECCKVLAKFARDAECLPAGLGGFGSFPTAEGVVFLTPDRTSALLAAHRHICAELARIGATVHKYYVPEGWYPHSTVGFQLPPSEVQLALGWLDANFKPLEGVFASIGLIEFRPVKELAAYSLRQRATPSGRPCP